MNAATRQAPGWRRRLADGCAVAVLITLPLVPGVFADGSAWSLIRLPAESILILLILALVPWRMPRIALATGFGVFVGIAILLAGIDSGYEAALGIRFVPLDWPQLGDAYGVVAAAIGSAPASVLFSTAAALILAASAALAWSALRVDALVRGGPRHGRTVLAAVTAGWVTIAAGAVPLGVTDPAAAAASTRSVGSAVSRAVSALETRAAVAREIAADPFADADTVALLSSLRDKHVVIVFVESYGRVAVEGGAFATGVREVLRRGDEELAADGYLVRSAWLTSPTFGGVSWLAHATLQSGIWTDSQSVYDQVVRSDRLTLSSAFGRAGWFAVSDVPSNTRPWDVGKSFYGYDLLLDATNVGYRGPSFGYARIPDQYTLKHFADRVLAEADRPVMAEIDLVSSHTPWTPLPQLVPWDQVGDGSVYDRQPALSPAAAEVWQSEAEVQRHYGLSIEYALGSLLAFLQNHDDPDLVVIALGDHQPGAIVSGADAGRDVPVSIIAKDPAVLDAIAGWRWQDGLRPDHTAPVWRMDAFRDRFFAAFGSSG
ncbi:CDP-alcohol phosphatidyltransferase [Microbacterium hibisci]|uniref:CDP-alcohol phosphatidyltransferase n=1 Tax=Microbacterium hibisci TaxID=2036000 RepID=UPI00194150F7|nr:CDP-alcohol phosphatidyltransferase [Microbacterium hibisci]